MKNKGLNYYNAYAGTPMADQYDFGYNMGLRGRNVDKGASLQLHRGYCDGLMDKDVQIFSVTSLVSYLAAFPVIGHLVTQIFGNGSMS